MSVLSHQEIEELCEDPAKFTRGKPLIENHLAPNIRTAGYDLRLGSSFYLHTEDELKDGKLEIQHLGHSAKLAIPPNQVVITSTEETLHLPDDLVGHLSLKLALVLKGLMMPSQSQIDAGYNGSIFVLLYNLSQRPVVLQQGDSVFRLEFARLSQPTRKTYGGAYAEVSLLGAVKEPLNSSLRHLETEFKKTEAKVDETEKRIRNTQIAASLVGAVLVLVGTFAGFFKPYQDLESEVLKLQARLDQLEDVQANAKLQRELAEEVESLTSKISALEAELATLRASTP